MRHPHSPLTPGNLNPINDPAPGTTPPSTRDVIRISMLRVLPVTIFICYQVMCTAINGATCFRTTLAPGADSIILSTLCPAWLSAQH